MDEGDENVMHRYGESTITAISVGFFLVLAGAIFLSTPDLLGKILTFFSDFDIVRVPHTRVFLPAPASLGIHSGFYSAVMQFCFLWGVFQVFILVLRFVARSPLNKKAETSSSIIFWLGASYLIRTFLIGTTVTTTWFVFWAGIIMLIGTTFVIRAIILATRQVSTNVE